MFTCSVNSRATEFRLVLAAFVLLAALFVAFPQLDLMASSLFREDGRWLFERESPALALPYHGLPRLGQFTLATVFLLWLLGFLQRFPRLQARRATLAFLLAGALAGPVLLVDIGLKDHSGRARPVNVEPFGGNRQFTPAFVPAKQCRKNCSFVSGHVATASFLMAFGWLAAPASRRRWLLGSLAAAGAMGWVRMAPGGHFLSDVIFAWFAVYFALTITERLFRWRGWFAKT